MRRETAPELAGLTPLAWPGFVLDLARGELLDADGRPTELRAQALRVLLVLGEAAGQVVGKDQLMRRVWGDVVVTEDSLVQAVGDIRRVIGDARHERVRTVPRRGYMLVLDTPPAAPAPVAAADPGVAAADRGVAAAGSGVAATDHGATSAARSARPAPARWPAAIGALLLVAAVGALAWAAGSRDAPPARSLAILPFESEPGTDPWFADAVTSDLNAIVAGWPGVRVVGRGTMAAYKGRSVDARVAGRELGVRYLLAGGARRDGDRVRLAVSLIDARAGQVAWSELRDVPRAELAALVGDVAGGIARTLTVELGDAVGASARALTPGQVEADDLAMQAVAELLRSVSAPAFENARRLSEQSLRLDPDCKRCLGGVSLANSNLVLWEWAADRPAAIARAEETAARLALLAPDLLITRLAQASLANIHRDWAGLLAVGDRLVEHYPNEPASHHHRCSALLRLGRFEDGIEACARATRISPRDSRVPTWQALTGLHEFHLGRAAAAEHWLRLSVQGNPRVPYYGVVLAVALAEQGRRDEALQAMQQTMARHPDYRLDRIANYWVASDSRFLAGRDRIVRGAAGLGLK